MKKLLIVAAIASLSSTSAFANTAGSHVVNMGVLNVNPDNSENNLLLNTPAGTMNSGLSAKVGRDTTFGFGYSYYITDNISTGFQLGVPPTNEVTGTDGTVLAEVKQRTPEINVKYHFGSSASTYRPFIGTGIAYIDLDVDLTNNPSLALGGASAKQFFNDNVSLETSDIAPVVTAGLNINATDKVAIGLSISYLYYDAHLTLPDTPAAVGGFPATAEVDVNPWVGYFSASYAF